MPYCSNSLTVHSVIAKVCSLGIILCCMPLFFGLKFNNGPFNSNHEAAPVLSSMNSKIFKYSLVSSISVAIPLLSDFILHSLYTCDDCFARGWTSRAALLHAILVPDSCVFFIAIPLQSPEILGCVFQSKMIVMLYVISTCQIEYFPQIFNCTQMIVVITLAVLAQITLCYSYFMIPYAWELYYINISLFPIILVIWSILNNKFFYPMIKNFFKNITSSDYTCLLYVLWIGVIGFVVWLLDLMLGPLAFYKVPVSHLTVKTYGITIFTVIAYLSHSRILAYENKMKQNTLDMKRMFVRYVSHEIRTPLNTVVVGLDVLKNELIGMHASDEVLSTMEDLTASCSTAIEILNDLLNYEKLESGLMQLEKKVILAGPFLVHEIKSFNILARQAEIDLYILPSEEMLLKQLEDIYINIDRFKLNQVIRNFISNALKFTPKGGKVSIQVRIVNSSVNKIETHNILSQRRNTKIGNTETQSGGRLLVEVIDSGAGIAKENLPKLFSEMVQFSPGTLQQGGGSGLGLWISKKIVNLHDGNVFVSSDGEGFGCVFGFDLPLHLCSNNLSNQLHQSNHATNQSINRSVNRSVQTNDHKGIENMRNRERNSNTDYHYVSKDNSNRNSLSHVSMVYRTHSSDKIRSFKYDEKSEMSPPSEKSEMMHDKIDSHRIEKSTKELIINTNKLCDSTLRSTLRILMVDDAIVTLKMMCRGLKLRGYHHITLQENGQEALSCIQESIGMSEIYDVVLTDYQMPIMDGPTSVKLMRKIGFHGGIIGITGNALPADKNYFISCGADYVITKPINIDELDQLLLQMTC